ncbi:hypothetical protein B0T20DRAFT_100715 [Sordaria brevicollis]|uniref:F-box domain-containing protein n=1 Tax=Sordaria brevicollis TaxID=83679 RepID=A0AAE0NW82_SORBR|nr:hypothetical protein B0T20DRAFT_100715 [Sordaria brevicollis]
MALQKLPVELLLEIPPDLGSFQDLAALARTCRRLYDVFNPLLYKYDVQTGSPIAMFWAARWGRLRTLQLSHDAGANLKQAWSSPDPLCRSKYDDPWKLRGKGNSPVITFMEMDRHDHSTYIQLFHDAHCAESVDEEFANSDSDDNSSGSEGEEGNEDSDNDSNTIPQSILDQWIDGPEEIKTASANNSYSFSNFIVKPSFFEYTDRGNPYPRFWWHPLDLAVHFQHMSIVEYLLDHGVRVQESHSRGICPFSVCHGSLDPPVEQKEHPLLPYGSGMSVHHPIILAACREDLDMQKLLLKKVGLRRMARRLTWDDVDYHHYEPDKCSKSAAKVLGKFATWIADI